MWFGMDMQAWGNMQRDGVGTRLCDVVEDVYIVAYKEDVGALERALSQEGLRSTVLRAVYSDEESKYANIVRCLLNHRNAWRRCAECHTLSMVVEADFVPVKGLANLPVPFDLRKEGSALGWLYAGGPTLYDLDSDGFARGHAAAPVAIVLGPRTARVLLEFADEELRTHDPLQYFPFDTHIRVYLQKRGINSYLPYRNYGEHGGVPNPEHRAAGLASTHRADVLYGPLQFLPAYARGRRLAYLWTRYLAKARGVGRLLCGRYLHGHDLMRHRGIMPKLKVIGYSVGRLLSPF